MCSRTEREAAQAQSLADAGLRERFLPAMLRMCSDKRVGERDGLPSFAARIAAVAWAEASAHVDGYGG